MLTARVYVSLKPAVNAPRAETATAGMRHRLLANPVIEKYRYTIETTEPAGMPGGQPAGRRPGWWAFSRSIASSSSAAGAC